VVGQGTVLFFERFCFLIRLAEPGGQCLEEKFQKKKINHSLCSWQGRARFCFLNGFGQCLEEKFQKKKINHSLCSWQGKARFCFLNGFVS
jgi:hypothetical protein